MPRPLRTLYSTYYLSHARLAPLLHKACLALLLIWHLFDDSREAHTWKAAVRFYEKSLLTAAVRFYTLVNDRSKVIALLSGVGWGNADYLQEKLEARWGYIEARATKR